MWPKYIISLTFHLQLLTQTKHLILEMYQPYIFYLKYFSACGGIPIFIAVKLYEKLVPEMHHFIAFHHLFLLR